MFAHIDILLSALHFEQMTQHKPANGWHNRVDPLHWSSNFLELESSDSQQPQKPGQITFFCWFIRPLLCPLPHLLSVFHSSIPELRFLLFATFVFVESSSFGALVHPAVWVGTLLFRGVERPWIQNFSVRRFGNVQKLCSWILQTTPFDVQHKLVWWTNPCGGQSASRMTHLPLGQSQKLVGCRDIPAPHLVHAVSAGNDETRRKST